MKETINPIWHGKVENGRLVMANLKKFREWVSQFEGKVLNIIIRKQGKSRSDQQNKYYWGVVLKLMSEHSGHTSDELHEAMKIKFLSMKLNVVNPETFKIMEIRTVRSTAGLKVGEFEEYVANVRGFAAQEMGLNVPLPNEVDMEKI